MPRKGDANPFYEEIVDGEEKGQPPPDKVEMLLEELLDSAHGGESG